MTPEQIRRLGAVRRMAASGDAKRRREALRLSLREMAALIEVQPSTMSRWERGLSVPYGARALRWHEELTRSDNPEGTAA